MTIPILTLLLFISTCSAAQPYWGTIFIDPDIIKSTDSSTFVSSTYAGMGNRMVYDRRVNNWITINAYLFNVVWSDGLTSEAIINPEFANDSLAGIEAEKYGRAIGLLPTCLRYDVNEIWIHKGVEPFGGGNFSILIHTGQSADYENQGILEETLVHEASHTSLDAAHANAPAWLLAQSMDPDFISVYAKDYPLREDIAETFLMWIAVRYRQNRINQFVYNTVTQTVPNRLRYFDSLYLDMSPFELPVVSNIDKDLLIPDEEPEFRIYPNPASDFITISGLNNSSSEIQLIDPLGRVIVYDQTDENTSVLNIGSLIPGIYFLKVSSEGKDITKKVLIER